MVDCSDREAQDREA